MCFISLVRAALEYAKHHGSASGPAMLFAELKTPGPSGKDWTPGETSELAGKWRDVSGLPVYRMCRRLRLSDIAPHFPQSSPWCSCFPLAVSW